MSGGSPDTCYHNFIRALAARTSGPQDISSYPNHQKNKMVLSFKASNQQFLRVNQITHYLNFAFQALNFTKQVL